MEGSREKVEVGVGMVRAGEKEAEEGQVEVSGRPLPPRMTSSSENHPEQHLRSKNFQNLPQE